MEVPDHPYLTMFLTSWLECYNARNMNIKNAFIDLSFRPYHDLSTMGAE